MSASEIRVQAVKGGKDPANRAPKRCSVAKTHLNHAS